MIGRRLGVLGMLLLVVLSTVTGPAMAAGGPPLNFGAEKAQNGYLHEDTITIASHDRGTMSSPLEYNDDKGNVAMLPATMNSTQDTPVGVRFDKVEADAYNLFPRVSGESENAQTWTNASNWTTSTSDATNVTPTLSDADADGVQKVSFSTSGMGAGDTATANFSEAVDITTDADKRVLLFVGNVDTLSAGAVVELRAIDGDGDYRVAEINSSRNANESDVIANGTTTGVVFQEKLANLPIAGTGDGTLDGIQHVEIVVKEADASVTAAGLDLDRKSAINFAEIERNTDTSDSDLETVIFEDYYEGGVANLTGLASLGSEFDSAVLHDLEVHNVRYQISDLTDSAEYSVNWSAASNYGSYDQKLELYADLEIPAAIDLSHGTLTLKAEQSLVSERYATVEFSENVADETAIGDLNDTDYTSKKSLFTNGAVDDEHTLDSSVSADQDYRLHLVILYLDGEVENLKATSAPMAGPTGKSGGGLLGGLLDFITTPIGMIVSAVTGLVGGMRVLGGGS